MEKIDLYNYEAWFLDYSEGNLSENQMEELAVFLDSNPDLKLELTAFEAIYLEQESIENDALKASLLREESTGLTRTEYLMIAQVEGNITKEEKAELATIVGTNADLMQELAIYHKTKLPKEETVVFDNKSSLVRKERKAIVWWTYASSAAAAAVIAFVVWNSNSVNEVYNPRGFAWQENKVQFEENSLPGIVASEKVEVQELVKKVPFSAPNNQFAQEKSQKTPISTKKLEKREVPVTVKPLEQENFAELPKDSPSEEVPLKENEAPENNKIPTTVDTDFNNALAEVKPVKAKQEFVPIQKFAKDKIKKDLLKGKTFSQTVIEEIADISNEKITFETNNEKVNLFESFALNIGKLSISRNR